MYKSEPLFLCPKNISSTFSQSKLGPLSHSSCTWGLKCLSIPSPITWLYSPSKPYYFQSKTCLSVSSLSIPPSHCFFWLWHLNFTLFLGILGTSITLLSTRRLCVYFFFFNFTILYWFYHISKWICHRYTCVPHPEPSTLLPSRTIPLGHPSAPAPSIQYRASKLDWRLVSYMILYMFQCHSPKSSHPLPLPQSPKGCSIHQCLFCCLVHRVIVTIFLNSIHMR